MATINERIREVRKYYELTQKQFAQKIGISREHLCRIESGKEKPSDQMLLLITAIFNVYDSWLFDGVGEMVYGPYNANTPEMLNKAIEEISDTIKLSNYNQDDMIESVMVLTKIFNKISDDSEKIMLVSNILIHLHDIVNQSTKMKNPIPAADYLKIEELKARLINDISLLFLTNN